MTLGTQQNPLRTTEPMKVARAMLKVCFEDGMGLREVQGRLFEWYGGKWVQRDVQWLEDAVWRWAEDLHVSDDQNGLVVERYGPTEHKVAGIVRALQALCRVASTEVPQWLDAGARDRVMDPHCCVAFRDVVVDVKASAQVGALMCVPRGPEWFDPCVVDVDLEPGAECPRWMRCLEEWSGGDEVWKELLQRWMGYSLMSHRRYAKWMLFHGKIRAGKGTIGTVMRWLLGGTGFVGTSLDELAGSFGLDGIEFARVMCVSEVSELASREGEVAVRVLKNVLGRDPISINAKYRRQVRNVVVNAAPWVQANEIPQLPNKGRGLSGKMLVLPFERSFEGKEQHDLMDVLKGELAGIAAWALKGAVKLEAAADSEKFPPTGSGTQVIRDYHLANHPFDYFLESRFVKNPQGVVAISIVQREWQDWAATSGNGMIRQDGRPIGKNSLTRRLIAESSWVLSKIRTGAEGTRALGGLSLKKDPDDELD
jgi:P4 family phage/plasmid primase-like protien